MTTATLPDSVNDPHYMAPPAVGVYGWSPFSGGVHRHRIAEPLRVLAEQGCTAFTGRELHNGILSTVDTVLAHQLSDEATLDPWRRLAGMGFHRLVLDVDDAMWRPDWKTFKDAYSPARLKCLYDHVQLAHVITTPSAKIAEHLAQWNPNVWIVPNTLPGYTVDIPRLGNERLTIGWQGSSSHTGDWTPDALRSLYQFLERNPDWCLQLHGEVKAQQFVNRFGPERVRFVPWQADERSYYESLTFDVGIGPLRPTYFNACKSDLRAREYAALGIVAALPAAPGIYADAIRDKVTGRLIHGARGLLPVLHQLADDPAGRSRMEVAARKRAAEEFTTEANLWRWVEAWNSR